VSSVTYLKDIDLPEPENVVDSTGEGLPSKISVVS